jgi:hypothetical protein
MISSTSQQRERAMTKQDLIDLAIEYGMIHSTSDFNQRTEKQQDTILRQIRKVAGA